MWLGETSWSTPPRFEPNPILYLQKSSDVPIIPLSLAVSLPFSHKTAPHSSQNHREFINLYRVPFAIATYLLIRPKLITKKWWDLCTSISSDPLMHYTFEFFFLFFLKMFRNKCEKYTSTADDNLHHLRGCTARLSLTQNNLLLPNRKILSVQILFLQMSMRTIA